MLTELGTVGSGGVTSLQAERIRTHEVVPFDNLVERVLVACIRIRVHESTKRVSAQIRSVWIHLTTRVASRDIDLRLVNEAYDLYVVRRLRELDAAKRARGYDACSAAGLRTPRHHLTLNVADNGVGVDRGP